MLAGDSCSKLALTLPAAVYGVHLKILSGPSG